MATKTESSKTSSKTSSVPPPSSHSVENVVKVLSSIDRLAEEIIGDKHEVIIIFYNKEIELGLIR